MSRMHHLEMLTGQPEPDISRNIRECFLTATLPLRSQACGSVPGPAVPGNAGIGFWPIRVKSLSVVDPIQQHVQRVDRVTRQREHEQQ